MVKGILVAAFALLVSCAAHGQSTSGIQSAASQGSSAHAPIVATVSVDLAHPGATIPSNFVGFSINTTTFLDNYFTGSASSLLGLMGLVGTNGVLRIGGVDQDAGTAPTVTTTQCNNLASFISTLGSGWTVIYGLDAVANNSAAAATTASCLATAIGTSKVIFQFGNEPVDNGNFTISTWQTMWNSYYTAVTTSVSGAKLAAWDDADYVDTQTAIAGITPGLAGLTYVSQHWYGIYTRTNNTITPPQLLSSIGGPNIFFSGVNLGRNISWAGSIPTRMTESNSVASNGLVGISDRLVASAWVLNEAITLAQLGWAGLDTFSNVVACCGFLVPGAYNSLVENPVSSGNFFPGAPFYGQYLFSKIEGQHIAPIAIGSNGNINAFATKGANGNANIIVVNSDAVNPATVLPVQSSAWTSANVLQIKSGSGAGCTDASITVGGQSIGLSGSWSGAPFSISNGQSISLGPCESALIQILP